MQLIHLTQKQSATPDTSMMNLHDIGELQLMKNTMLKSNIFLGCNFIPIVWVVISSVAFNTSESELSRSFGYRLTKNPASSVNSTGESHKDVISFWSPASVPVSEQVTVALASFLTSFS